MFSGICLPYAPDIVSLRNAIVAKLAMRRFIFARRCIASVAFFKNADIATAVVLTPCIALLHFCECETML